MPQHLRSVKRLVFVGLLGAFLGAGLWWTLGHRFAEMAANHEPLARPITAKQETKNESGPTKEPARQWDSTFLSSLGGSKNGDPIRLELLASQFASGTIDHLRRTNEAVIYVSGKLIQPESGRFFFQKQTRAGVAGDFVGVIELPASGKAYRIEPTGLRGAPELVERPLARVVCANLPPPVGSVTNQNEPTPQVEPGEYPDVPIPPYQNGIIALQSLPGAIAVIYLDFQGGYTPTWGGVSYDRPSVSNAQIRDVWRRVVEDFMPFNLNVTTDLGVFQSAPEGSRAHVIITPTTIAAPGEGGAAYVGSFNWTGDTPCWVFEIGGKVCAEVCSHEAGHTLGLSHEGQEYGGILYEYYSGHGVGDTSWAPIMGLPYAANVTQWSKGEYLYADNPEDQLGIIVSKNNNVGYRPDDVGSTLATARYLELYPDYTASAEGLIKRSGETNAFQFTTSGGYVWLQANPVSVGPNLALQAAIYDGADNLVLSTNPQTTLGAALSTTLPSGTYTFRVSGAGRNSPLTDGFSSYASLGYYSVTGLVANARLPERFTIPQYSTNGTFIGTVTPNNANTDPLSFRIVPGTNSNAFAIDNSGALSVANESLLDSCTMAVGTLFPVEFELFVSINDLANPSLSETNSRVLVDVTYVPTPPLILDQPQGLDVTAGTNVSLVVKAIGDAPLAYQWRFNETPIANGTTSALALTNVQSGDAGRYAVVITNLLGSVTSSVANLSVRPTVAIIIRQPQSQGVFPGFAASFSVVAAGSDPLSYQWQFNGTNIDGATASSLAINSAQLQNAGSYRAVINNQLGSVASAQALLTIIPVAAWGGDAYGQTNLSMDLTNVVQISAGANHNLALRRDGSVVAWGSRALTNVPSTLTNAIAIAAGGGHSLALTSEGSVVAWGDNSGGQTNVPPDLSNVVAIAAGGSHSLALGSDGLIRAWGQNALGQISIPNTVTNVIAIAAGTNHSLALGADGKVYGWGGNSFRQSTAPTNLDSVVSIAAGGNHSLALRNDGTVVAWGEDLYGQSDVPTGLVNIVAIAAGSFHSLALNQNGNLIAWGAGLTNQAAYPEMGQSMVPATVNNITAISAGDTHSIALGGDGAPFITEAPRSRITYSGPPVSFRATATGARPLTYQWQFNGVDIPGATGQLLTLANAFTHNAGEYRVVVTNLFGIAVSSGAQLSFRDSPPLIAVQPDSQRLYLGSRTILQTVIYGSEPFICQWRLNGVDVPGATNATLILDRLRQDQTGYYSLMVSNAFGVASSIKIQVSGVQVVAWGQNPFGEATVPNGLSGVVSVAGGLYHSLALKADGTVVAWGVGVSSNSEQNYGQTNVPPDLTNAVAIAAGAYHSLALRSDGTVVAWGAGNTLKPGFPPNVGQSVVPVGLNRVIAVSASLYNSMALRSDGTLVIWGLSGLTNVPPAVPNLIAISSCDENFMDLRSDGSILQWGNSSSFQARSDTVAIAAGGNFGLGLRSNGKVFSWGGTPVPTGLSNVVQIAAGGFQELAITGDGSIWAWGGLLTPIGPPRLSNVVSIAAGENHSLAIVGDGSAVIQNQPVDETGYVGEHAVFVAVVGGFRPLGCQWNLNGVALPGATNTWLMLGNLQTADSGGYSVVVTNMYGAVTSRVARLQVLWNVGQGVDAPGLKWSTSGDAVWFGQTNFTRNGLLAAQSGRIGDNQQCSFQTTLSGSGTLSFWWKVSSEQWFDFLTFSMDGVQQAAVSGEVDWQPISLTISNGVHTLKWTYAKDPSGGVGLDAGWVAQVSFVPDWPEIIQQPLSQTVQPGATVLLSVVAAGAPPLSYQWLRDGLTLAGATTTSLNLMARTRLDSAGYAVIVSNNFGVTFSSNAMVRVRVPQELSSLTGTAGGGFTFVSSDSDGGQLWRSSDVTNYLIQASQDLVKWQTLTNPLVLTNGALLFRDLDATNHPARFYRVMER